MYQIYERYDNSTAWYPLTKVGSEGEAIWLVALRQLAQQETIPTYEAKYERIRVEAEVQR